MSALDDFFEMVKNYFPTSHGIETGRLLAKKELTELREDLVSAIELAEEGIGYTPRYFREKWGMEDKLSYLTAKYGLI